MASSKKEKLYFISRSDKAFEIDAEKTTTRVNRSELLARATASSAPVPSDSSRLKKALRFILNISAYLCRYADLKFF